MYLRGNLPVCLATQHKRTCQLSRFSWESPSFSLNLPVSPNAFLAIFGGYSWALSLMTFSQCKDFQTSPDICTLGVGIFNLPVCLATQHKSLLQVQLAATCDYLRVRLAGTLETEKPHCKKFCLRTKNRNKWKPSWKRFGNLQNLSFCYLIFMRLNLFYFPKFFHPRRPRGG